MATSPIFNVSDLTPSDSATTWTPESSEVIIKEVQIPGPPGPPPTIAIGTVTKSEEAEAAMRPGPTEGSYFLDLWLPEGERGQKGNPGDAARFEKVVITTLPSGSPASGSITGTAPNYTLNLSIPAGPRGQQGEPGPDNYSVWISQPENEGKNIDDFWESLKGESGSNIELGVSPTHIQWRVVGDDTWIDLVALSDLKGDKGDKGDGLKIDVVDTEANKANYDTELAGFTLLTSDTGMLYVKRTDSSGDWYPGVKFSGQDGTDGTDGTDGKTPEFQMSGKTLQWRYVGDTTWIDLITFPDDPSGNGIETIQPGTSNVTIDSTDPKNPIISVTESTGPGGGREVEAGQDIVVDGSDPAKFVVATSVPISRKGPPGKHKFWRWSFHSVFSGNRFRLAWLRMFDAANTRLELTSANTTVTASAQSGSNYARNAFYNDSGFAYWEVTTISELGFPIWAITEFAEPTEVVSITLASNAGLTNGRPTNMSVEYSDDGTTWTTLLNQVDIVWAGGDSELLAMSDSVIPAFPTYPPKDGKTYVMRDEEWLYAIVPRRVRQYRTNTPSALEPGVLKVLTTQQVRDIPNPNWVLEENIAFLTNFSGFARVNVMLQISADQANEGHLYGGVVINGSTAISEVIWEVTQDFTSVNITTHLFPIVEGDQLAIQLQSTIPIDVNGGSIIQIEKFY